MVEIIKKTSEDKKFFSTAFLDVTQVLDQIWHEELLFKLETKLPHI